MSIGYNSHGTLLRPLSEIYEIEDEKGNEPICEAINRVVANNISKYKAIWILHNPLDCFREYVLGADCYSKSDEEIILQFPDFMSFVYAVDLTNLLCIFEDKYAGCLYITLTDPVIEIDSASKPPFIEGLNLK